jgi:GntR family transcriptional regulator
VPFDVELDYDRGVPVYRQIYEAVVRALASRRLAPSERLPTIHALAEELGINPNTVVRAYKDLERDGHIVSQRGRGTFASESPAQPTTARAREKILRGIYEQATAEAAKHHISPQEVVRYFEKACSDE